MIEARRIWEPVALAVLVVYYLARLLDLAATIAPDLPPDEETHVGIIRLYAAAPLGIDDSPASYRFGLVTRVPFLYHLALGKLLAANLFGLDAYLYLRLWNVLLALATVGLAYALARLLTRDPLIRVLLVALATNTLMASFLAASVSYDNLVNLLAVAAVYFLIRFFKSGSTRSLLAFLLSIGLGALTKVTFLPLAVILIAILLFERRRTLARDAASLLEPLRRRSAPDLALGLLVLATALTGAWLYGGNLWRYGRPDPTCPQVLAEEACMENRIHARNRVIQRYRDGELSFEQAVLESQRIRHPGDRDHALRLLHNERQFKMTRPEPLNVYEYVKVTWSQAMKPTIFGIQAHRSMLRPPNSLLFHNLVLLAGVVMWIRTVSWRGEGRWWVYLAILTFAYAAFLLGFVNYRNYLSSHAPFAGVQGRYLFPVLVPAYLVLAGALLGVGRDRLRVAVLVLVSAVWILGDFPYFHRHAGEGWFRPPAAAEGTPPGPPPG